jgi:hypothetical protein
MPDKAPRWRVGRQVPLNVYRDNAPMFQCHTPEQAAEVVELLNRGETERERCARIVLEEADSGVGHRITLRIRSGE